MTNETTLAFETPEARAAATAKSGPLDRISVRDYTRDVEIGAFQAERGVTQRIRFNVVLEVSRHAAAQTDDVDQVLSYDSIVEAIEHQLSTERINLLETLAERIAEEVLKNPKAVRIFVRIEKLDRIPGTLGIEIVRSRVGGGNVSAIKDKPAVEDFEVHPLVVFLPNTVLHSDGLRDWLNAIDAHDLPAIICLEKTELPIPSTSLAPVNRRMGLLSIEQNAWLLASEDSRCMVVDSRTELDWAMKNGQLSVWAPSKVVLDAVNKPDADADDPLGLAQWFAREFSADHISVCGAFAGARNSARLQVVETPAEL
ncbi:MAG: FolB domain-containing protein [Rhodobacteraceae bacterium]|nr:FolB domain-containing protein [Paracoccaceae bacterium]